METLSPQLAAHRFRPPLGYSSGRPPLCARNLCKINILLARQSL